MWNCRQIYNVIWLRLSETLCDFDTFALFFVQLLTNLLKNSNTTSERLWPHCNVMQNTCFRGSMVDKSCHYSLNFQTREITFKYNKGLGMPKKLYSGLLEQKKKSAVWELEKKVRDKRSDRQFYQKSCHNGLKYFLNRDSDLISSSNLVDLFCTNKFIK